MEYKASETKLHVYVAKNDPFFVTAVYGPILLEDMQAIHDTLDDDEIDDSRRFFFGDLPDNATLVECVLGWDNYDDASYPVFNNVKVIETLTEEL